ncbi:DgyrCDS3565 [Dimorphilus gyrociliatus]|uniref:DgyrCDS3565 n=1 Tax=Dimorphilus gyrociliatus TaxID=2664684 RepID=A0A7I8VDJ9_9ANNE|nr:DgyrCDS3565 [Dimorphilus gyrociliatus]
MSDSEGEKNKGVKREHDESDKHEDREQPQKKMRIGEGSQIECRILLPSKVAGAIIGKGGSVIKGLREECGLTRILVISATTGSVCELMLKIVPIIEENDEREIRLLVHQSQAGCIIGKAGAKIKELREQTGANIKVFGKCCPDSTERVCAIGGSSATTIADALGVIFGLLQSCPPKGYSNLYEPNNCDEYMIQEYGGFSSMQDRGGRGGRGGKNDRRGGGRDGGRRGGGSAPNSSGGRRDRMSDRGGRRDTGRRGMAPRGGFRENFPPEGMRDNRNNRYPEGGPGFGVRGGGMSDTREYSGMGGRMDMNRGGYGGRDNAFAAGGGGGGVGSGGNGGMTGGARGSSNYGGRDDGFDSGIIDRGNFGGEYGSMGGRGDFSASRDTYDDDQRGFGGSSTTGTGTGGGMRSQMGNRMGSNSGAYNKTFASDSMGGMGNQGVMFGGGTSHVPSSTQVSIPRDLAGAVIGKGGSRIRQIREESGASIIMSEGQGNEDRIITINGSPEQIQNAQYLLQMRASVKHGFWWWFKPGRAGVED